MSPSLYHGTDEITAMYHGSTEIVAVYNGSELVWEAGGSTPIVAEFVETKTAYNGTSATSHTFARAMNRASGDNRFAVIGVFTEGSPAIEGNTVAWNGVAFAQAVAVTDNESTQNRAEMWVALGGTLPGSSNTNIVITPASSTSLASIVAEYDGIGSTTPDWTDTDITDPDPNPLSGTSTDGALVIDMVCCADTSVSPKFLFGDTGDQNERFDAADGNSSCSYGMSDKVGVSSGTVSMQVDVSTAGGRTAYVAASFPKGS